MGNTEILMSMSCRRLADSLVLWVEDKQNNGKAHLYSTKVDSTI